MGFPCSTLVAGGQPLEIWDALACFLRDVDISLPAYLRHGAALLIYMILTDLVAADVEAGFAGWLPGS